VYSSEQVYDGLDALVQEGRVAAYGVTVETVEESLTAIRRPRVATVQIILNAFRQKPLERVLPTAADAGVGILARVPLACGLLSGRYTHDTRFADDDHRSYNRHENRHRVRFLDDAPVTSELPGAQPDHRHRPLDASQDPFLHRDHTIHSRGP
jgi:aryl-alcohol dehydrogenase-like predicted oxidoreductase